MATWGITYQGSKSAIADSIIASLPSGKRFVDLFGGGFAMSHCALFSYKYKSVLYNDINPLLVQLIKDAIDGKYNRSHFIPEWISRDEFYQKKDTDGYVRYCWSFAGAGKEYIYGKDSEEFKRQGHEFCVHKTPVNGLAFSCDSDDIHQRRLALNQWCKEQYEQRYELESLERLQRLEGLEALQKLERSNNLQITCMDYRDYQYQDGDVVYCDIPYTNTASRNDDDYDVSFDAGAFYTWAIRQRYPVYMSSYSLGGIVWEGEKTVTMSAVDNSTKRREVVYCIDDNFVTPKKAVQTALF